MPLPRQAAGPSGDMRSLYNLFRINPNSMPGVNPGAFAETANDEIAQNTMQHQTYSPEMQREQAVLANADQRAEVGIRGGLEEAEQVRDARNLGFEGSHPLKERADYETRSKLAQVLMPKQLELEAARQNKEATMEFTDNQNDQNRDLRRELAAGNQGGQDRRMVERSADIAARSVKPGHNPLRSIFGGHFGIDSNEDVQRAEQNRVRDNVRSQMNTTAANTIPMIAPDGRRLQVPEDRVEELEAQGAQRVQ